MQIKTTTHNEISIEEVRRLISENIINCPAHIVKNCDADTFAGMVTLRGENIKLYAGDEVTVHNVSLPLAIAAPEEFDSWVVIN